MSGSNRCGVGVHTFSYENTVLVIFVVGLIQVLLRVFLCSGFIKI